MNMNFVGFAIFATITAYSGGAMLLHLAETALDYYNEETGMEDVKFTFLRGAMNGTCPFRNILTWPVLIANCVALTLTSSDPVQTAPCIAVMLGVMLIIVILRAMIVTRVPQYLLLRAANQKLDKAEVPMKRAVSVLDRATKK